MARVKLGGINTYVPTVEKRNGKWFLAKSGQEIAEDEARFLKQAGYKIPDALHAFAVHLDGSNWKFASGFWEKAAEIKEKFHGKSGIRVYASPEVTWLNEEEQWEELREAIGRTVDDIKASLSRRMKSLTEDFGKAEELDGMEADGKIVDRINEAKGRLKRLSFIIASLALSDDFREAERGVSEAIESELVLARRELGKRYRLEMNL